MKVRFTLFFLLINAITMLGQPPTVATPTTYPAVAQEIGDLFGSTITATTPLIEGFLANALVGAGTGCDHPDADVASYTPSSLTLTWHPVNTALQYQVRYLNLQNPAMSGVHNFSPAGNDLYTLNGLIDGLYLITIQAHCANGTRSNIGIIIADKDVMIAINPRQGCGCRPKTAPVSVGTGFVLPPSTEFILELELDEGEIKIHGITDAATPNGTPVEINPNCGEVVTSWNNVVYPTSVEGALHFDGGIFNYNLNEPGSFEFTICKAGTGHNEPPQGRGYPGSTTHKIGIAPNPSKGFLQLTLPSEISGAFRIDLLDLNGKLVQSLWHGNPENSPFKEAHLKPNLATGLYLVRLQTADHLEYHRLFVE